MSFGLKALVSVASKCVACMQPDSIKPAARIPNLTFSDDIGLVPIETNTHAQTLSLLPKFHDSDGPIIG